MNQEKQKTELIDTLCPICESRQELTELYPANFTEESLTPEVFSARRVTEHYHYRIVKCKCGMIFSNPILPEEKINELYAQSLLTYDKELENITESYYSIFKNFFRGKFNEASVLEFGCGNGFFLKELLNKGVKKVVGIEPGQKVVEMSDPEIKPYLQAGFIEDVFVSEENLFDAVCSFQTLDHVYNPLDILKKCHELCKPEGICLIVTHNTSSLQAKILKDKSPIIDIEHIYLFNKKTLSQLMEKAGFSDIEAVDIKNTYSLKYWVNMTPFPKFLKRPVLNILKYIGLGTIKISIKAGNIAVVGKKANPSNFVI
jgi:2-polyprenyl-3-methyl-5-hydroxy-6-metoxy-1,4-benzoquinol methylase